MSIADLLNQTVTIEPKTGEDIQGKPSYGAAVAYAARVRPDETLIKAPDGSDVLIRARLTLLPDAVVSVGDRATLPDGQQADVLTVGTVADGQGEPHHIKVGVG